MDFLRSLDEMNAALREGRVKIKLPRPPSWAEGDPLSEVYHELPVLLSEGSVYYSGLVQANKLLFEQQVDQAGLVSAATIVYSHNRSKSSAANPHYMTTFAHYLFTCKKKEPEEVQPWLADAVRTIRGETDRSKIILTADEDESYPMNLTMQSLMVFRQHLLKLRLGSAVIPIIAAPGKCSSVIILPCVYWNSEFKKYWIDSL